MNDKEIAPGILRMDAGEIDLLDQENALLELEDIVDRVRTMAAVNYDLGIEEVWEFLDIGRRAVMPRPRSYWRRIKPPCCVLVLPLMIEIKSPKDHEGPAASIR